MASKPFEARYPGRCEACGDSFDEGDAIRYDDDDDLVGEDCCGFFYAGDDDGSDW